MPNANVLEAKKAIVAELTEKLQNAASGVLVDYKASPWLRIPLFVTSSARTTWSTLL